jgi:MFS family permease
VRRTALGWLVYQMTGSHAMLGTVLALALLPMFVLSPTAGAIADRVDKRRMILLTQVLATLSSAAIATLVFLDLTRPWHLMVLATLGGVAFAFEVPARQAFVVEMVGRDRLMNAIALNSALVNLSRIFGPAIAGLVMGTVGMGFCFALDAASYLVVMATLLALRLPPAPPRPVRTSHWQELMEGVRELQRNRRVRTILLLLFLVGTFGWSFQTLLPAIAQDLLHLSEQQYGVLMSMFGLGAIVGALLVAGRKATGNQRRRVFGGVWILTAGLFLVSMTRSMLPMGAALVLAGFGAVTFLSTGNTLVQTSVDDRIRGRIMGLWAVAFGGSLPLGSFLAGIVADVVSPYTTIAVFTLVLLLSSLALDVSLRRRARAQAAARRTAETQDAPP